MSEPGRCDFYTKPRERCQNHGAPWIPRVARRICREHREAAWIGEAEWDEAASDENDHP